MGLEGKLDYSERGKRKNTKWDTRERKNNNNKNEKQKQNKETQGHRMRWGHKQVSHVWSNSSLLEIGPSSAAEERVCVVSKHGFYMFS